MWLNDGSGTFTDTGQALRASSSIDESYGVDLADVDGDGDVDAFVANYNDYNKVWLNDGSGNFTDSGQSLRYSSSYDNSWDIELADLDGDGDLDASKPIMTRATGCGSTTAPALSPIAART